MHNSHLEFKRLPSHSPQLNVIEGFRRVLRRRATHNRLFDSLADLKRSIREPVLLPGGAGASPAAGRQGLHPPRKPESISGLVNEMAFKGNL